MFFVLDYLTRCHGEQQHLAATETQTTHTSKSKIGEQQQPTFMHSSNVQGRKETSEIINSYSHC